MENGSIASAKRRELRRLELRVLDGALPPDLCGHVFVVAPVGNVGTDGFPGPQHESAINGDGMIYRIDLAEARAHISTRLVRSADFYTDEAAERDPRYVLFRYMNAGILRISPLLGARDYGNTALLGFRLGGSQERLLVTFDGGRPLEIDPVSLDVITPVGAVDEWRAEALPELAFPPILTTAHPVCDELTGEIFLVNYGRSLRSLLLRSPLVSVLRGLPQLASQLVSPIGQGFALRGRMRAALRELNEVTLGAADALLRDYPWLSRRIPEDFLYLARWDGAGAIERLRVIEPDGTPVRVRQTMHQIALTRNFVVLMDTSMKLTVAQTFNAPLPWPALDRVLRAATTGPQPSSTRLYFIRRADLQLPARVRGEAAVVARRLELPLEATHFQVDYADNDDLVTLHVHHDCTVDVAEWVRDFDREQFGGEASPRELWGVPNVTPTEINRLARYVVHAPTASLKQSRIITDDRCLWGLSLYAGEGVNTPGALPERLSALFHVSPGFQPELVTEMIYELYETYPHRMISPEQLGRMVQSGGRPSCIFRVNLESYTIDQARDVLELPDNAMAGALQFVPRANGTGGYLIAFVIVAGSRQIWVLDSERLAQGPICRLQQEALVFGATLHSWWLPKIAPRSAGYRISPERDYGPRIAGRPLLEELFEREVYPHFRAGS